jgi:hypothetical protein
MMTVSRGLSVTRLTADSTAVAQVLKGSMRREQSFRIFPNRVRAPRSPILQDSMFRACRNWNAKSRNGTKGSGTTASVRLQ